MTSSTKPPRPSSSIHPLKRGAACLNCRHFKIKCDGKRPHCTPCLSHPKEDECEYQDGPRSRTKALEDKIAALEAHIFELENPNQEPAMQLSEPYSQPSPTSPTGSVLGVPFSPTSELSQPSPLSASSFLARFEDIPKYVEEEPSVDVIQSLLDFFLPHAGEIGFFLNTNAFSRAVLQPPSTNSHARPCPALLYAVYLWGNFFSQFHDVAQERTFESRALRHCALDLASSSHPDRVMHGIQANVLLSHFYLKSGRLSEAVYFATGAATLVTSAGLHSHTSKLPSARTSIEAGERVDAFWTVFSLTRVLAIVARPTMPSLCPMLEILGCDAEVPWPLPSNLYQKGIYPDSFHSQSSVAAAFMQGVEPADAGNESILVLEVKASLVLNEVSSLVNRWEYEDGQAEVLLSSHQRLSHVVTNLRSAMPRLHQLSTSDVTPARLLAVGSMIEAAGVTLFRVFAPSDQAYRTACAKAAASILNPAGIDVTKQSYVSPIMGLLWSTAIDALEQECERLKFASPVAGHLSELSLRQYIARGLVFLRHHAARNPIVRQFSEQYNHRDLSPHSSPNSRTSHSFPSTPIETLQSLSASPHGIYLHQRSSSPASSVGDYQGYQNANTVSFMWPSQNSGLGLSL
ncbi:hypothetical protein DL96DRAFT_1706183 [Flagelloscypha sp. PMI_526]|nr:hypothetical protein DL96DRAFT_1706183 [Flagelloscypha sp. PMI_526]